MRRWARGIALLVVSASAGPGCGTLRTAPNTAPPNVLVVVADSLRADQLAVFTPDGVPTPALAELARRGVVFENAWAATPWTAPSVVSIFTGLAPPSHGVVYRDDTTPRGLPTLPRLLAEHGWRVGSFAFFSDLSYFRNLGFPRPDPGFGHELVPEAFATWLDRAEDPERPFVAWAHLIEPHLPYGASGYEATTVSVQGSSGLEAAQMRGELPVGEASFDATDRPALVELYRRDVAATDRALGRLLDVLRTRGLLERTIVVFTADHGEELLEDGWVGHASTAHQAKLLPETLRIPLVVAGPGLPRGVRSDALAQQVDVFPTLCRLLGMRPPRPLDGETLIGRGGRLRTRVREHAFFDTSIAGNPTPAERRGERIQGATDGRSILAVHERPGEASEERLHGQPCSDEAAARLRAALADWRRRQARQRLAILEAAPAAEPPAATEIAGWATDLGITRPAPGARLEREASGGQIELSWDAPAAGDYWIEYRVGREAPLDGIFPIETARIVFGPFPEAFWNDLARRSPYRFRVLDRGRGRRSEWVVFTIEESR